MKFPETLLAAVLWCRFPDENGLIDRGGVFAEGISENTKQKGCSVQGK